MADNSHQPALESEEHRESPSIQTGNPGRVRSWIDRVLPADGGFRRLYRRLVGTEAGYKARASLERLQASRNIPDITPISPWSHPVNEPLPTGEYLKLSTSFAQDLLKRFSGDPSPKIDILVFPGLEWESQAAGSQQFIQQLAGSGHRVIYVQPIFSDSKTSWVKIASPNLFLVKIPISDSQEGIHSPLSMDEVVSLRLAFTNLRQAFNIHTAVLKVDHPSWQPFVAQLKEEFGWKLIYDRPEHIDSSAADALSIRMDDELLIKTSDLVLFSSDQQWEKFHAVSKNSIVIMNSAQGEDLGAVINPPEKLMSRVEILEKEIRRLYPMISILLVTFNKLEYTRLCLDSIARHTDYPKYEIIIVDNGSSDGTVAYLEEYQKTHTNITLLKSSRNLGFAAGNNLGVRSATGEYLVFLNNDTFVTSGWLGRLLHHLEKDPKAAMVGSVTNAIGNEAKIEVEYTEIGMINEFAARRGLKYTGIAFQIRVLALYCAMLRRDLYLQLDGLDERYQTGMFEDDDLAEKIRQAGFHLLCAEDVFIHHFHGVSFTQFQDQELQRIFHENRIKFEQKWGHPWQVHQNRPSG